jgi:uncharacterized protein
VATGAPAPESAKRDFIVPLDLGRIAQDLQIRKAQVEHVVQRLEEGYDPAFLARFRRDETGGLNELQLRQVRKRLQQQKQLVDRKQSILRNLEAQGKLTVELRAALLHADTNKRVEDLYLPFKPKRKSAAASARDKGLEPLALAIFRQDPTVANLADLWATFVNPDKQLATVEDVQAAVKLLLAELRAEHPAARDAARRCLWEHAKLTATRNPQLGEGLGLEFKDYFQFSDTLRHLAPHRIAAINRGERAGVLSVKLAYPAEKVLEWVAEKLPLNDHPHADLLRSILPEALTQFLAPALEKEIRRDLTDKAEEHAAGVMAKNLRRLLLQPPLPPTRLLAIDPGYRSGCRLAVLDEKGALLEHAVVYPHALPDKKELKRNKVETPKAQASAAAPADASPPASEPAAKPVAAPPPEPPPATVPSAAIATQTTHAEPSAAADLVPSSPASAPEPAGPTPEEKRAQAKAKMVELVRKHGLQVVALGNSTGSRETEELLTELIAEEVPELSYHVVPECGATQYSLSPLGREELPQVEAAVRAAVSLGRRLQDPLAELIKMDPVQLGQALSHHEVPEKRQRETLAEVVESCVNEVGLDVNSATVPLLKHVAGLNPLRASSLVQHRQANGPLKSREALKAVAGMTELAWRQAVGFLRIADAENPLDRTWIHPDLYETAAKVLEICGADVEALVDEGRLQPLREKFAALDLEAEGAKFGMSPAALDDLLHALARPGKDPRSDHPAPIFKKKQLRVEDLQAGMELRGTVLNVVDFGAFIDVGLKDNGLVHISQLANRFIKNPYDLIFVGDVVTVWVLSVDQEKRRVSLTMIPPGTERKPAERRPPAAASPPARRETERPPKKAPPRFAAQIATPDKPSGPLPSAPQAQPRPAGARPAAQARPAPRPPQPKKERPLPKLSQEALKGKSALRTFGELKALYEAKRPGDEKKTPPPVPAALPQPTPDAQPAPTPADEAAPAAT